MQENIIYWDCVAKRFLKQRNTKNRITFFILK